MRPTLLVSLVALAGILPGACAVDRKYSQTELNALQTREYDAPYERTFDAAVGALFDAGYVIRASDKRGGFVSAERWESSFGGAGHGGAQLKIDPVSAARTTVRISTTSEGQGRVDKARIDELAGLIGSRLVLAPAAGG